MQNTQNTGNGTNLNMYKKLPFKEDQTHHSFAQVYLSYNSLDFHNY